MKKGMKTALIVIGGLTAATLAGAFVWFYKNKDVFMNIDEDKCDGLMCEEREEKNERKY